MITLEDWIMIKHMHKQGVSKTRIAKELGLDRKTVRAAIDSDGCPKHEGQSGIDAIRTEYLFCDMDLYFSIPVCSGIIWGLRSSFYVTKGTIESYLLNLA